MCRGDPEYAYVPRKTAVAGGRRPRRDHSVADVTTRSGGGSGGGGAIDLSLDTRGIGPSDVPPPGCAFVQSARAARGGGALPVAAAIFFSRITALERWRNCTALATDVTAWRHTVQRVTLLCTTTKHLEHIFEVSRG